MKWNEAAWARQGATPAPVKRRRPWLLLVAALAGVAVAVIFMLATPPRASESETASAKQKSSAGVRVKNKSRNKSDAQAKNPATNKAAASLPRPKVSRERIEKRENIPAPPPVEELNAALTNATKKTVKVPFRNRSEQLIALALPSSPGAPVPPLPPVTDESLAKHLEKDLNHVIKAEEGDSEELLEKKVTVLSAKDEFRELREREGWSFTEYIQALRDKANEDSAFLAEAHKLCDELYHDKTISDVEYVKYRDEVNEKLRERGLPEIGNEEEKPADSNGKQTGEK